MPGARAATSAWTRSQPGTTRQRALLYMDEVFGFFPPTANSPSKQPMLTLLEQVWAYGLGGGAQPPRRTRLVSSLSKWVGSYSSPVHSSISSCSGCAGSPRISSIR